MVIILNKNYYNITCQNLNCNKYIVYDDLIVKRHRIPKYCSRKCLNEHRKYLNLINRLITMKNTKLIMSNGDIINITKLDQYFIKQKDQFCEICNKKLKLNRNNDFAIDHCHYSKKFRGLLCTNCNLILGWYEKYNKEIYDYLNDQRGFEKYENL